MKRSVIILAVTIALFARPAFARIGETAEECEARYGNKTGQIGTHAFTFSKDHITITVLFENDRSVREMFTPEFGEGISEQQVVDLLSANSGGSSWKVQKENVTQGWRKYERADGAALATYEWQITLNGKAGKSLMIRSWKEAVPNKPSDTGF